MKEIIKELLFKLGLKKYQWKFITRYIIQTKNRILYSNSFLAEKKLKKEYFEAFKKELNLKNPVLFTEKIQYRKLYPNNNLYTKCTDKYLVREYMKVGEKYLIPLYYVGEKITKNEWDKLPNSFVIKPNHDTANTEIIFNKELLKEKADIIMKKLNLMLKVNFGWCVLEKHYIGIKPQIIVEKLLLDKDGNIPNDYKFHCFKNKVYIQVIKRNIETHELEMNYLNENWKELNFETGGKILKNIEKPKNLNEMLSVAKKLSEDFEYVRVDMYNIDGDIYFGELTFTPFSGLSRFNPEKWDFIFGEEWK